MNCSPFDLRDYFLKELSDPEKRQVDAHVKGCVACREELERLSLTEASLLCLRDEEIPQRIAFVSDKIFEPSPLRRWWSGFWTSTGRLGFASAAMLSTAIIVYALHPVAPVAVPVAVVPHVSERPAIVQTISDSDIQARIDAAVTKAVDVAQARHAEQDKALLQEMETTRKRLILAAGELDFDQKRSSVARIQAANWGGTHDQEALRDQDRP